MKIKLGLPKIKLGLPEARLPKVGPGLLRNRYVVAATVPVALAALYGTATVTRPGEPHAGKPVQQAIRSAVLACPGGEAGRVAVQTASVPHARGRVSIEGPRPALITSPGQHWTADIGPRAKAPVIVRADGDLAAGLSARWTTLWPHGRDRGAAATRCVQPGFDQWFLGPGPLAAEDLQLVLTNVDGTPASVDLTALSGEGPLDTLDGQGVAVAPHSSRVVRIGASKEGLGAVVQAARDLALRVRATSGRVAAALRVRVSPGHGIDWEPVSSAPAKSLVLPGVPSGPGDRRLLVAVPGEQGARIRVRLVGPDGTVPLKGQDGASGQPRTVATFDLHPTLAGRPAAVLVDSDKPVVAGFTATRGADVAFGTSSAPLGPGTGPGEVPDARLGGGLVLTALTRTVTVTLTPVGGGEPRTMAVPAGRTIETSYFLPGTRGLAATGLRIEPDGPLYAGSTLVTSGLVTAEPVPPSPLVQLLPPAHDTHHTLD
ncbi:DUF5719 family protein [Actinomadura rupiterrae]|uniref:DUF5719 family protein n=1 Tax=Actinomadura rupiterrae TaxID=559627 RepID=UPI0020A2B8E8|nr:DUF5719 family protein [Actinomadura rupiterrae]MCP2335319.1 hypothetical protein [Actinomadura rupiterrae]